MGPIGSKNSFIEGEVGKLQKFTIKDKKGKSYSVNFSLNSDLIKENITVIPYGGSVFFDKKEMQYLPKEIREIIFRTFKEGWNR